MATATKDAPRISPPEQPAPGPIAVRAEALPAAPSVEWLKRTLDPGQIKTLCATVAPADTPEDVLAAFFWSARRRGLDPFLKQVHLVKRRRRAQLADGSWGYETYWVHQTGIDGFRLISSRVTIDSGKLQGERALNGISRGCTYDEQGRLIGAWAEVYRKDCDHPFRCEVDFAEYCPLNDKGSPMGLWAKMPKGQIQKCAEAGAHRMANPEDLGDTYEHAEFDAAEHVVALNRDEPPPTSSATAPPIEGIVDGEIVQPVESKSDPFTEEAPASGPDPRGPIIDGIMKTLASFEPRPTDSQWTRITGFFTGASRPMQPEAFAKVDPAALADLRDFLRGMHAGDAPTLAKWKTEVAKWKP